MKRLCVIGCLAVGVVASGCSTSSAAQSASSSALTVGSVPVGAGRDLHACDGGVRNWGGFTRLAVALSNLLRVRT